MTDGHGTGAAIVARAKAILLDPGAAWPLIAAEPEDLRWLFARYVGPLAAIGPVSAFLHAELFGFGPPGLAWRPSLVAALAGLAVSFVVSLAVICVVALVVNLLAPSFGGRAGLGSAFKLVGYSGTAACIAGIANLVPGLGPLGLLGLYSAYLFYTGARPVMGIAQDKVAAFTGATVVLAIALLAGVGLGVGPLFRLLSAG